MLILAPILVSKPVPLTIVKGAGHEFIPLPNGENATVADFHSYVLVLNWLYVI